MLKNPIRVLFLLQRPEAWCNVASVLRAMTASEDFIAEAWLLPYNIEDKQLSEKRQKQHSELLIENGVSWKIWFSGLEEQLSDFDVVVFTHPYDRERPQELWFHHVRPKVAKIVYIPYGLSVGGGRKNLSLQFAQPLQQGADIVVARSRIEKKMYEEHCPTGANHLHIIGHPRFDWFASRSSNIDIEDLKKSINDRFPILWNSHFSFFKKYSQSSNFSTFDLLGPEIFRFFINHRSALCLIWRPHPGLFPELVRENFLTWQEIDILRSELVGLGIILDEAVDHVPSFVCSGAMISDPGSFLFEYLVTGKPILPLINDDGEPLNREADDLIAGLGSARSIESIAKFISSVTAGHYDVVSAKKIYARHISFLDGCSGSRLCKVLLGEYILPQQNESVFLDMDVNANRININFEKVDNLYTPPVLNKLINRLIEVRREKSSQTAVRKFLRSKINGIRVSVGERVKKIPWLMALILRVRSR